MHREGELGVKKEHGTDPFLIVKEPTVKTFKPKGEWTSCELAKYVVYIEKRTHALEARPHSMLWPEYKLMAKFIRSRNYRQCKTQHQRLRDQYVNVAAIVDGLLYSWPALREQLSTQQTLYQ